MPNTRIRAAMRIRVYGNTVHWMVTPAVWVRVTTFSCCSGKWISDAIIDSFSAIVVVMFPTESLFSIDLQRGWKKQNTKRQFTRLLLILYACNSVIALYARRRKPFSILAEWIDDYKPVVETLHFVRYSPSFCANIRRLYEHYKYMVYIGSRSLQTCSYY